VNISWNGRFSLVAIAALLLSACGGGSSLPVPVTASAKHHTGKGRLVFRIRIPKHGHHHRVRVRGRDGKPRYISAATQGLTLDLTGPTKIHETVSLLPSANGCTSTLATTLCTLTIPSLTACSGAGNCYSASIATYDGITGCPTKCSVSGANELSANETIPFRIVTGQPNTIAATLYGIPYGVTLVPSPYSTLSGSPYGGFTLSKCGSDQVDVFGIDFEGNYILGAGAPVPSLQSDNAKLTVATPAPFAPNTFTISRSNANLPLPGSIANLAATVTPDASSGQTAVTLSPIEMTFDASTCGAFLEFPIPTAAGNPQGIALGGDGNLWFVETAANKIGRITTTGAVTEFSTGLTASSGLARIALGPDGNMWFTESGTGKAGSITPSGTIAEYPIFTGDGPFGIAAGADDNLWVTESSTAKIGIVDTTGALDGEPVTTAGSHPNEITSGPDNNLWFTEGQGDRIGRVTTDGVVAEFNVPTAGSVPFGITAGEDGNLWFTECVGNKIGVITTAGAVTEFPVTGGGKPLGITSGADGNIYFALSTGNAIGQIPADGSGTIVEFSTGLTAGSAPNSIAVGADGNLWFTEAGTGKIGRLQ
jgi:streptogramin lyase